MKVFSRCVRSGAQFRSNARSILLSHGNLRCMSSVPTVQQTKDMGNNASAVKTSTTSTIGFPEEGEMDSLVIHTPSGSLPVTAEMNIVDTQKNEKFPCFRILDPHGNPIPGAVMPDIEKEDAVAMYKTMIQSMTIDDIFYNAQRQGRISFYMQNLGEEGTQIGSSAALKPDDMIFAQYRELGVLLWRGYTTEEVANQCFANEMDTGKGRMMPVHYGSKKLNFQTISSPLTTQLPQAVGAAYAMKLNQANAITIVYFGEGAASEGDFHAAMNFAATLECPMIFFCRNNGYAISTPVEDQYKGDGIASRAAGYGMHAIRVDGNDLLAVKMATEAAREIAIRESRPVFIESMSYRRGHHSTSDDSTRYRSVTEIKMWEEHYDPVKRFRKFIEHKGWWSEEEEQEAKDKERVNVLSALENAESAPKPPISEMFTDVYAQMPKHIRDQRDEAMAHVKRYPDEYDLNSH